MKYTEYCVKQNIVDWNNNVMESEIVRDSICSLESAEKIARELQHRNMDDFGDLLLKDGYRYTFTVDTEIHLW